MIAINLYIFINKKSNKFRYFNIKKNNIHYRDDLQISDIDVSQNYLLDDIYKVCIYNDIYLTIVTDQIDLKSEYRASLNWKIKMELTTYNHNQEYITNFIDKCINEYDECIKNKNQNKTYHFIYQGLNDHDQIKFSTNLITDFSDSQNQNYETFDNIFHKHKQKLINDIDRLKDINYYKKSGLKKKKGYLFYGPPGCGKTSTVMAISNYDKRHIIEIPLSRVKTNNEFEQLLNLTEINNIKFNFNNIIILFDELDIGIEFNTKNNNENDSNKIENKDLSRKNSHKSEDRLSLNTILSRLDGIGNYNGLIIIATSNNINNLDTALYRDGRLSLVNFDNATMEDITNIIEKYYNIKLNDEQIELVKKINNIPHSKLIFRLELYDDVNEFISSFIE
jgi:ATP-dependent Zn protease